MASYQGIRRRSSAADRESVEPSVVATESATTTMFAPIQEPSLSAHHNKTNKPNDVGPNDADIMPPPPPPTQSMPAKRHSRTESTASASRATNRLSLTLPIAPPSRDPSRPVHTPGPVAASAPPTPTEKPAAPSPSSANEFIIAIAAQERKVLELKEELARAEADLASLKKQWTSKETRETTHKRGTSQQIDLRQFGTPTAEDDAPAPGRSVDIDRRKLLLQTQCTPGTPGTPATPTQNRRRVLRGGHTRTLSLLSPARTNSEFAVHEDDANAATRIPPIERRMTHGPNSALAKRASWQPRSQQNSPVVPQIVEDFKLGLRAFVEDIRQITIGDEPISGQAHRPTHALPQRSSLCRESMADLGLGIAGQDVNGKMIAGPGPSPPDSCPPTPSGKEKAASTTSRAKPIAKNKHFSWTPLGFDSLDDADWANWESPGQSKTARWSGSTINSGVVDDIQPIPEIAEEAVTPVRPKSSVSDAPILSPKLEEILPSVVNRFSPSNLKRTANNLMDEWEKSLATPEPNNKENAA